MSAPEFLLVGGGPYSGKSTISGEFVATDRRGRISHLSMGAHLRAIAAGTADSDYAEAVRNDMEMLKHHVPMEQETITGVFLEFLDTTSAALVVVDGHPRGADLQVAQEAPARLIAVCRVDIDAATAHARSQTRTQRFHDTPEDAAAVDKRLVEYATNTLPVLALFANEYPYHEMDGTRPVVENVAILSAIYRAYTS